MIATIRLDSNGFYQIRCKNPKFIGYWGKYYNVSDQTLFLAMSEMTDWANNTENEELTFEVE